MKFKKIITGIMAGVLAVSLSGCADNGYIMKVDGMDIKNGVYLYYQQAAYATACDKLNEIYNASSSGSSSSSSASSSSASSSSSSASSSSSMDFFTQSIDNKSSSDWVKSETLRLVRQFVAVQRLAEEKNITLSDEDLQEINDVITEMWDTENYIYQIYYGFNNLGEYYERNGISRETMKMLYEVSSIKQKLFMAKYDKGGEQAVSDADFTAYLKEHYVSAQLIEIPYNDKYGNSTTDEQRIEELQLKAQNYVDMLREGKSFVDVKYECELAIKKEIAEAEATDAYNKEPVEGKTLEEYVKEETDKVTVEKSELKDTYSILSKDENDADFDENLYEYIKNATEFEFAIIYPSETDKCVYVVVVNDITKNSEWQDDSRETVLTDMKGDEFEGYLDIYSQNYSIEKNSYLVDTKYSPEKIFKSN